MSSSGAISVFLNAHQNLGHLYAKVLINIESSNGDLVLANKTVDSCEFFKNPRYEPILQVFYKALTRTGTFPKRCPITKVYDCVV